MIPHEGDQYRVKCRELCLQLFIVILKFVIFHLPCRNINIFMSADCKYSLIFILFKLFDNFYMTRIDKIVNNNRLIEVFRSWDLGGSIDEEYFIL